MRKKRVQLGQEGGEHGPQALVQHGLLQLQPGPETKNLFSKKCFSHQIDTFLLNKYFHQVSIFFKFLLKSRGFFNLKRIFLEIHTFDANRTWRVFL